MFLAQYKHVTCIFIEPLVSPYTKKNNTKKKIEDIHSNGPISLFILYIF